MRNIAINEFWIIWNRKRIIRFLYQKEKKYKNMFSWSAGSESWIISHQILCPSVSSARDVEGHAQLVCGIMKAENLFRRKLKLRVGCRQTNKQSPHSFHHNSIDAGSMPATCVWDYCFSILWSKNKEGKFGGRFLRMPQNQHKTSTIH